MTQRQGWSWSVELVGCGEFGALDCDWLDSMIHILCPGKLLKMKRSLC